MDKLAQAFDYQGAQVRIALKDGEPWFVAKDVAEILGYAWNGMRSIEHVPPEWRGVEFVSTPSGIQEMAVLSEQGLYFFLARSDKPRALPFQKWIAGEVLPQLRKTGVYALVPKTLPEALRAYADEVERRQALEAQIEADRPKVEFYDAVAAAEGLHTMNEAAKLLGLGPNKLFALLRGAGVLLSNPKNVPRMEFVRRGYFVTREKTFQRGAGAPQEIYCQTYVTGKGMQFLERFVHEHVKQKGFPGHRPGGGKAEKVLRHEYGRKASLFGGM